MIDLKDKWVPQNLKQLERLIRHKPCLYGLPLVHLYYTTPKTDKKRGSNRITEDTVGLHLFRIIVGTTWNWLVCNASEEYVLDEHRLKATITSQLQQAMNKKYDPSAAWWAIVNLKEDDPKYIKVMLYYNRLMELRSKFTSNELIDMKAINCQRLHSFMAAYLSDFIADKDKILVMYVSLETQAMYKKWYKSNAIKKFREYRQAEWSLYLDNTIKFIDWSINIPYTSMREKCFLPPKALQRALEGHNPLSAKYSRKATINSKQQPENCLSEERSQTEVSDSNSGSERKAGSRSD